MLKRWAAFTRFLDDGRICLSNNAAERALRGIALGRRAWLFAGSDRGGERAAAIYTLIATAKLNDIDPQAWLARPDRCSVGADEDHGITVFQHRAQREEGSRWQRLNFRSREHCPGETKPDKPCDCCDHECCAPSPENAGSAE